MMRWPALMCGSSSGTRRPIAPLRSDASFQEVKNEYSPWDEAAKIIQRAWRRHACKKVFRNVQKMIGQCYQQDPSLLLRTVNPQEAELLDAAAGVYIQFRLGGVSFPPQIYYKIFTYRPIVDIGANSPKDYHQLQRMKYLTEKRDPTLQSTDRTGWYQRVENNNWRLFSCKSIIKEEPIDGFVTKKIDFHPSKMQRIQDVRKWKKRKKIEWLKRMYKEGREEALEEQSDQSDLLTMERKTMKDVMSSIEDKGEDEILDWELDEHLTWTNSFNFEEYMEEWINQACNNTSEQNKDHPTSKFNLRSTRYKEGREEALEEQSDQSDLLTMERKTTKDVMSSIEDKGEDEILDWEQDEHLARTNGFNFEEYMEEWINQACGLTSEQRSSNIIADGDSRS
ncbi:protein MFI-like isoform X2 [Gambusia affinis]|uniref:protein MFI-like isoform X2 n=1 Tax=Gambusia affinis TaxID=33528 RepID=UPI001CDBCE25|nr:protein MFI-like isoform X2 [Gambusia affinis]